MCKIPYFNFAYPYIKLFERGIIFCALYLKTAHSKPTHASVMGKTYYVHACNILRSGCLHIRKNESILRRFSLENRQNLHFLNRTIDTVHSYNISPKLREIHTMCNYINNA